MEASKLLIASIAISLVFVGVWADAGAEEEAVVVEPDVSDSVLKLELEQLRSKISALEYSILDKTRELKSKDENIAHLEKIIEEKSVSILSLQSEIESVQRKGAVDAEELVKRANLEAGELGKQVDKLKNEIELQNRRRHALDARASEAEKKVQELNLKLENVDKLKNEIELQNRRRHALDARASEAEKKVQELNLKLENLQKTNDEQRHRIQKTERALKVAEEELMRAQLEATAKSKELSQAHGAWLPPWLAAHISHYQELSATYWKEHAKPALDVILEKASEKLVQAQKWVEPQLEIAKTKWVPAIKERWVILVTNAEPYVQIVYTKTVEVYHTSKGTIATYVIEVLELADPYFQVMKKISKPYIDQVATITKPHVERMQVYLKPYTKRVVLAYGKFLKSATTYHHQVQAGIREHLKRYELTKVLATKELVWFMASALLALPIFLVYRLLLNTFCSKKTIKSTRNGDSNHTRRKPKHRHADK